MFSLVFVYSKFVRSTIKDINLGEKYKFIGLLSYCNFFGGHKLNLSIMLRIKIY